MTLCVHAFITLSSQFSVERVGGVGLARSSEVAEEHALPGTTHVP